VAVVGGAKLEAYLKGEVRKLTNAKEVRVGFLEGATYPDGTPVATIAAIQNFGAPSRGIPPRPFFSNLIARDGRDWSDQLARLLRQGHDARSALTLMGLYIEGGLRQSIVDTNAPPLAEATIARKGFDKPLVDTGHMLQSVDSEVS
jgi:hypothetical protein